VNTKHGLLAFMLIGAALLTGCDSGSKTTAAATQTSGWPSTFDSPQGKLTIKAPPQRIVSTSVTLTGALLTINAGAVNTVTSDEQGFFRQ
jgi:ferric enterobactin transport system substrate-binding protein